MAENLKKTRKSLKTVLDIAILAAIVIVVRMFLEKLMPMFYERFGLYFSDFLFQTLSNYPLTIAMVVGDMAVISFLNKRVQYGTNSMMRTSIELLSIFAISFISSFLLRLYQNGAVECDVQYFDKIFFFTFVTYIIFNGVVLMILDVINYYRWSHKKALAQEVEKRSAANYQYQLLKSQLNPHFLFNSLNVLDFLIQTDQEKASDYVKRLASIYRYLLKIESHPIVMVEEELAFVKQYINLLHERFSAAISFDIDVPDEYMTKKIVPCGMQMMIENAVKHNVANLSNVLRISVYTDNDYIVVKNNIQLKLKTAPTTGLGLNSIKKQYTILFGKEVVISDDGSFFEAKIPLID
jgi:two-component system, LytTR family, sensor kinase